MIHEIAPALDPILVVPQQRLNPQTEVAKHANTYLVKLEHMGIAHFESLPHCSYVVLLLPIMCKSAINFCVTERIRFGIKLSIEVIY
jgi:hypothetical protein